MVISRLVTILKADYLQGTLLCHFQHIQLGTEIGSIYYQREGENLIEKQKMMNGILK